MGDGYLYFVSSRKAEHSISGPFYPGWSGIKTAFPHHSE
jgi:hypothetical protein